MKRLALTVAAILLATGAHAQSTLFSNSTTGHVGIGNASPGAMLDIGSSGTTLGTLRLDGNTSGYVQLQSAAAAGSWTMTLPPNAGTNGYVLQTNGSGVTTWSISSANPTVISAQSGTSYTYTASDNDNVKQRSNSGTAMADTLPGTSPGIMAAGWETTIANADASALMSVSVGSGAVLNGAAQGFLILGPNQQATIASDGTNYYIVNAPARVRLNANTTLYVSTSGSDSNTGLASGSTTSFQTLQKAVDVVASYYDLNSYQLTIQLADGTYSMGAALTQPWVGGGIGNVIINGNATTPSNVLFSTSTTDISVTGNGVGVTLQHFKVQNTSGWGLEANRQGQIAFSGLVFGTCSSEQVIATVGSLVSVIGDYSITGGAPSHIFAVSGSVIRSEIILPATTITVTLSGTPAFTNGFAHTDSLGEIDAYNFRYSGSATGARYTETANSVIAADGQGTSLFPGNAAGTTSTGAQYIP